MWHSKTYPSQEALPFELLHDEFRKLVTTSGSGVGHIGVFVFYPPRSREVTLYFSPEAAPLARLVDAQPCDRPELKLGMGLYLGAGSPTQTHFPESFPPG